MRKKIMALLLALALSVSALVLPASAAGTLKDVSGDMAVSVEVLRLMGVLDGYGDGTFRPAAALNRAQFCKMVTYLTDGGNELGKYQAITIFPDVKPSHWASAYVNLAARGAKVIAGFPDGNFHPERTVTAGQAVTILLRLLGYTDEEIGGVWPSSQMAMAESIHLTDGTGIAGGNAPLTRGQAAGLFVNFLRVDQKGGDTYYHLGEETTLISVDGGAGTFTTADQKTYDLVRPAASSALVGMKGQVVLNAEGKALTFLPTSAGGSGAATGAVVIYEDGSTAGLSALTGGSTNYVIYKNGSPATAADLKKNDVAVWNSTTRSIQVCDTRVTVYYENCTPNPDEPTMIEVLGGTQFAVLPSAVESLSKFKPGQQLTLLLTADGQVAAAAEPGAGKARGNAVGIVSATGEVQMFCGMSRITLAEKADADVYGKPVRITSSKSDGVKLAVLNNSISGDLNVTKGKLGSKTLADGVQVFRGAELVGLGGLDRDVIPEAEILYTGTNWKGEVSLIVLEDTAAEIYGRVVVDTEEIAGEDGEATYKDRVSIVFGNGESERIGPFPMRYGFRTGDYASVVLNEDATKIVRMTELTQLKNVPEKAWMGKSAVTFGGRTYSVAEEVLCYNQDGRRWITLEAALAYGDEANLYARNGVIHVVEVGG